MKRLLIIRAAAFLGVRAFGQTTYYVDPLYSGGGSTGAPAHPWTTLASGWSTINTSLASGAVTVYLSASIRAALPELQQSDRPDAAVQHVN